MRHFRSLIGDRYARIRELLAAEESVASSYLNLIGSANIPFPQCIDALACPYQANPAEGRPGRRFFPKCESLDDLEIMGDTLARRLFSVPSEYGTSLQPYSGTQANQVVYNAVLEPGDTIAALRTDCGGHVSHRAFPTRYFRVLEYGVTSDGAIDLESIRDTLKNNDVKLVIAGASSYPRAIDYPLIAELAHESGASLLADISHTSLFVAAGLHPSPFGAADFVTMTTHKTTRGPRGGIVFYRHTFAKAIHHSIFPVSQGAVIFGQVLSKVAMLIELLNMDISAYAQRILEITQQVGQALCNRSLRLLTSGTDTHLLVLDMQGMNLTGKEMETRLERRHILANRNLVPGDPRSPLVASGLRLGLLVPATLGFADADVALVSKEIGDSFVEPSPRYTGTIREILDRYSVPRPLARSASVETFQG